jgi:hypothetical protein
MTDDPNVIPFGKHKGKTIEEVQTFDPQYLDWLTGQPWFRDRFVVLHQTIINRGAEPEETPDHNVLQALFLDDAFCVRVAEVAYGGTFVGEFERRRATRIRELEDKRKAKIKQRSDELPKLDDNRSKYYVSYTIQALDAAIVETEKEIAEYRALGHRAEVVNRQFEQHGIDVQFRVDGPLVGGDFAIEIKPSVGDDYPAILRQMNVLLYRWRGTKILFIERYIGVGATVDQFEAIFRSADINIVFRDQAQP